SPIALARAPTPQPGDGQGTIQIRDSGGVNVLTQIPVSTPTALNLRFTVGSSSITGGGKISVRIPDYWTLPCAGCTSFADAGRIIVTTINVTSQLSNL